MSTLRDTDFRVIDRVVGLLEKSRRLLFITGAGISADSGVPTYRGDGGLYCGETTEDGLPIEEVLSGVMLRKRPHLTWKYLGRIEEACRGARCNRAHQVIAEMETHFDRVWTLTQNVDGLHRQAGARNVIDIHGDLHHLCCTRCGFRETAPDYSGLSMPPRCLDCAGHLRPDVVLFGEQLPVEKLIRLHDLLGRGFDLVFTIGTTSTFAYVAGPVKQAVRAGTPVVEINPGDSEVSHLATERLALGAAAALDAIWKRYLGRHPKRSKQDALGDGCG